MNIIIGLAFKTIISVKKGGHDKPKFPKLWEEREQRYGIWEGILLKKIKIK